MSKNKPTVCVDFDGVIHSYTSPWVSSSIVLDPPVPGAMKWLYDAVCGNKVRIAIYSSRSKEMGGIEAMRSWLIAHMAKYIQDNKEPTVIHAMDIVSLIEFPKSKSAAIMTIDDRAICFQGDWAAENLDIDAILSFKPWNKQ